MYEAPTDYTAAPLRPIEPSSCDAEVISLTVAPDEIAERGLAIAKLTPCERRLRDLNKALAERVEAQTQERDRIWHLSQDIFVVSDETGLIVNVNPAWHTALGWSALELIGKSAEWLTHPDDLVRSRTELANLVASRTTRHFENRLRCKEGSYCWLSWSAVAQRGFIYASGRDVTNLKKAEEQSRRIRRELTDASRRASVDEMTASIAHEIKQPLSAIVSNADAASRWLSRLSPDVAEAKTALDQIVKDSGRITEVIESIRSMFGRAHAERTLVDVRAIVAEVLALCQGELDVHHISLKVEMRDDLPQILAVHVQLQQVITNLVVNAIEAMSGTAAPSHCLTINSFVDKMENITITVEDTGIGVESAHIDRIFEPFFTTKSRGMGLGLAICRSIVEAHGGKLLVSPRRPFGTVFHLKLPVTTRPTTSKAEQYWNSVAL